MKKRIVFLACLLVVLLLLGGGLYVWHQGPDTLKARAAQVLRKNKTAPAVRVEVVNPVRQGFDRTTVQPGTVQAYESADLYAEVSGYLKKLHVDLGSQVKEGDVLAELDVPELVKQQAKADALVIQAEARVGLMKASIARAEAEFEAARAAVPQATAVLRRAKGNRAYREKRYGRMLELVKREAVEKYMVEEAEDYLEAAKAGEETARLGIATATAQVAAAKAKIAQALADEKEAVAEVAVAKAEAERAKVLVGWATIRAPYAGIITKRNMFRGAFVRSAKEGERVPLLAIDRTDKVRVVVQIPDREVPYADKDDPADVEFEALGGKTFKCKLARTQGAEDALTRTMRVEIDLDNPKGELRPGMFAKVNILLQKGGSGLTIPAGCQVGATREGQASVFVVRDGKAVLKPIRTGLDNGVLVEVLSGLTEQDLVIRRYSGSLTSGTPVKVADTSVAKSNGQ
jgi:RND family efflux transporter MFP subunit